MGKASLPTSLARLAASHVGRLVGVEDLSHDLSHAGGNLATFRVRGSARAAILKSHRSARTFGQELRAYRDWVPRVPDTPALLGHRSEPPLALLLESLPGVPLAATGLPAGEERRLHGRAGRWLRSLHDVPHVDRDPVPLEQAYRRRVLAWDTAPDGAGPSLRAWIRERLADVPASVRDAVRVPCHLDFEPRNWLVDGGGRWVAVIDFEHARPDHPLADLARLAAYVWPARADLADAFLAGYDAAGGTVDRETVAGLAVLEAARRLAWASRHRNETLARSARHALAARGAPREA